MIRKFVLATLLASASVSAQKAVEVNSYQIKVNGVVQSADLESIRKDKKWPAQRVELTKKADDKAFESLSQLGETKEVEIAYGNEHITSFAPLAKLKNLSKFKSADLKSAEKNPISLKPLASCKELRDVDFYATEITDVNALASCKKLNKISFYMAKVDSLDFLESTPDVTYLELYGSAHSFSSYEPVSKLKNLTYLNVYMNKIADDRHLKVLENLTSLEKVGMANGKNITKLDFLRNCLDLEEVGADWCREIEDISGLANLEYLQTVELDDTAIKDIKSLANKPFLKELEIGGTQVSDLSPLRSSKHLENLDISETAVQDLSPIKGMRLLRQLNLSETQISDLSALSKLKNLQQLDLSETKVIDLKALSSLKKLSSLNIQKTLVKDLSPLYQCNELAGLEVSKGFAQEELDKLKAVFPALRIRMN